MPLFLLTICTLLTKLHFWCNTKLSSREQIPDYSPKSCLQYYIQKNEERTLNMSSDLVKSNSHLYYHISHIKAYNRWQKYSVLAQIQLNLCSIWVPQYDEKTLYIYHIISLQCVSILYISRYRNMRLSVKAFILEIILPHLQNCFVSCLMPSPYLAYKAFSINMSIMLIAYLDFDFAPSFSFMFFPSILFEVFIISCLWPKKIGMT